MRGSFFVTAAVLAHAVAGATDVDLSVEVAGTGADTVTVAPGEVVNYQVVLELTDNLNEGLASVLFDMSFEGGPLTKANEPTGAPMDNFARPKGMSNPNGIGGTAIGGDLIQVGGAQNTIQYFFPGIPTGTTITQIGKPGNAVVVVTGSVTAPNQVGTFQLTAEDVDVNVIRQGELGFPFYAVEKAGLGTIGALNVEVKALFGNPATLSVATTGTQTLNLNAGAINAGRQYWVLGSFTGTSPGLLVAPGVKLPLNLDVYMNFLLAHPNAPILANNFSTLSGSGQATSMFNLPHVPPAAAGLVVSHAYVLLSPQLDFASNPVDVLLVP